MYSGRLGYQPVGGGGSRREWGPSSPHGATAAVFVVAGGDELGRGHGACVDREGFAGQGAGYDAAAGTVEFNTSFSWSSWKGQDMEAVVREPAPGSTQVSVTGGLALKEQLTSWGEKKRIAKKVLACVERQVAPAPAPAR